jgi:response regulator RpfG family c-di-GMP phosphodiesterase
MSEEGSLPTVALIDDDEIYQFISLKSLQAIHAAQKVLQFLNGKDALNYLIEKAEDVASLPDYIFLDINMPLTDGWMFMEEFKKIKNRLSKEITIYMVSSSIDQKDIKKAKEIEEITDYVFKPISAEKFSTLLSS